MRPGGFVEPLDRAVERLAVEQVGDALAVDGRVAELDRRIKIVITHPYF